jgi:hypothetical protein
MKLTFGAEVNTQSLPSTPPYMIIRQCPIKHWYFYNFLVCMSLFKCRLHMRVNAQYLDYEGILGM